MDAVETQFKEINGFIKEINSQIIILSNQLINSSEKEELHDKEIKLLFQRVEEIEKMVQDFRNHLDNGWRAEFIKDLIDQQKEFLARVFETKLEIEKDKAMKNNVDKTKIKIQLIVTITSLINSGGVIFLLIKTFLGG